MSSGNYSFAIVRRAEMSRLKNKVCLITGAASGIGEGVAQRFSREGAILILVDTNNDGLRRVKQDIVSNGGSCECIQVDVTDHEQIIRLFNEISDRYGKLDILHTNTWWASFQNLEQTTLEDWNLTLNVTLTAPFLFSKYAIPLMRSAGGGSIIHTSSIGGIVVFRNHAAYIVAKAAVNHLCKSIAVDFGSERIRCNAICPGIIETPSTKKDIEDLQKFEYYMEKSLIKRIGSPADIAAASVFLASDEAEFVTGTLLPVDSGWGII
jgi:NAD(P)-dependent dehydrogenase (short-subunit alcohol dehydrogenase family)